MIEELTNFIVGMFGVGLGLAAALLPIGILLILVNLV